MEIRSNIFLRNLNTFGLEAKAQAYVEVGSEAEAASLLHYSRNNSLPKFVLGGGSNILLTGNLPALVIKNMIKGIEVEKEDAEQVILRVGAGVLWHHLVMFAVERNWGGIENLSLIPGTVGAAPVQNIGAYGTELKDVFVDLESLFLDDAKPCSFNLDECMFGYRHSIFKSDAAWEFMITSIRIRLSKKPKPNIGYGAIAEVLEKNGQHPTVKSVSDAVIAIRKSKLPDPAVLGNAGSFFKNPSIKPERLEELKKTWPAIPSFPSEPGWVKVAAGWLIEKCGWKGKRVGNCGVHSEQALVLVNYGQATGAEIKELAKAITESVKQTFGIDLNPEVNILPDNFPR